MEAYLSPDNQDCFLQLGEAMSLLELLIGVWVWEELLEGAGMTQRHYCKAHPDTVRSWGKLQLWSFLWDLQAAQRLGETSLCNSVEVVYFSHDIQKGPWWSLSASARQVRWCWFTSWVFWATPLLGGGGCFNSEEIAVLCKRRAFRSKVWFSWVLNDGGWESIFTPHPQISQVTSWSHWSPVHRGEGRFENRKWSMQW